MTSSLSACMLRQTSLATAGPSRIALRSLHQSAILCSGHNRWSKIRHRKGAADSAKSTQFSKITNEIYMSLRPPSSPDPALNPRLSAILAKAREVGYPKSNVDTAMNKALNPNEGAALQSIMYEAVGPGGQVGLIMVKEQLNKYGGRMSPTAFLFERKGLIRLSLDPELNTEEDKEKAFEHLFELAVEAGAEDVRIAEQTEDSTGGFEVVTPPAEVSTISSAIGKPFMVIGVEVAYLAVSPLRLPVNEEDPVEGAVDGDEMTGDTIAEEVADKVFGLVDGLEETGDVVKVWTNVAGV